MYRIRKQSNGALIVYTYIHAYAHRPKEMENWPNAPALSHVFFNMEVGGGGTAPWEENVGLLMTVIKLA